MFKSSLQAALVSTALVTGVPAFAQSGEFSVFADANEASELRVDYGPYAQLFEVLAIQDDGRTLVAYEAVKENASDFLAGYTEYLSGVDVTALNRNEQLAFWLNTRNFLVVKALSEERSFRNFDDKRGTPTSPGPLWTAPRINVNGVQLSIHDIETDIILTGWDSPFVVYGLYQGLKGGPALQAEPFTGTSVEARLRSIASAYTENSNVFRVRRGNVRLGEFYEWYAPIVFAGDQAALLTHVRDASQTDQTFGADAKVSFRNMSKDVERFRPRRSSGDAGLGSGGNSRGGSIGRGS